MYSEGYYKKKDEWTSRVRAYDRRRRKSKCNARGLYVCVSCSLAEPKKQMKNRNRSYIRTHAYRRSRAHVARDTLVVAFIKRNFSQIQT